ncbi:hypothetical protein CEXT_173601 [Caerostris extrusa]|uniref:Uncharacterized protein n=1 Tax=Caerostris extrusa TaxID=172846 RepID=A0AAV4SWW7_CAEEX|nr:hypothetical protein CEXT_173601 [Caerostris extrusa]
MRNTWWFSPQIASERFVINLRLKDRVLFAKLFYKNEDKNLDVDEKRRRSFKEIPVIKGVRKSVASISVDVVTALQKGQGNCVQTCSTLAIQFTIKHACEHDT